MNCVQNTTTVQQVAPVDRIAGDYMPTPDQIAETCLLIQSGWSEEERQRRWHQQLHESKLLKYSKPIGRRSDD